MGSKKIWNHVAVVAAIFALLVCGIDHEAVLPVFIDLHEASLVVASVTIVGRRPNGHQVLLIEPLHVAFLSKLVCPSD